MNFEKFWLILVLFLAWPLLTRPEEDLYRVLGVGRSASPSQIKTAYRNLAKEWHPDKNKSPEAKDKFIGITTAYEVLSDDEKRRRYDLTGRVEDSGAQQRSHHSHQGFTVFQSGNGFQFHFQFPGRGSGRQREDTIGFREFSRDILPGSHRKPYLIYFYGDFCFECMRVDSVWSGLKHDLPSLGIGMATVHTSLQPQVVQHCSVSRVPSIVGVVSGRVVHFNGWMPDSRSIKNFVKNSLPAHVVIKLTESNMEQFLSDSIPRNRPRVILFSRSPTPSLIYHLTAFYLRGGLDFAHVPTVRGVLGRKMRERFGMREGEKTLMVFKEESEPVLVQPMHDLNRDHLLSLLEEMILYLPRLSSPAMLDTTCPISRLCAVLVVGGISEYNDFITTEFRKIAQKNSQSSITLVYVDGSLQADFLGNFEATETTSKCKNSQENARKILILRRLSRTVQYKWFDKYCGQPLDDLSAHFLAQGAKTCTLKEPLLDEEAPGWLGRQWNALVDYYYSFVSAINMNMESVSLLMSLLFASMLLCVMAALQGVKDEDKEKTGKGRRRPQATRHRKEEDQIANGVLRFHYLTSEEYSRCVLNPDRGIVTLVLLVDTSTLHGELLLRAYGKVLNKHRYGNLRLFFLCYRRHGSWFEDLLARTETLNQVEAEWRVRGCVSGCVATTVVLFGAKKQLVLFPENFKDVHSLCVEEAGMEEKHSEGENGNAETLNRTAGVKGKSVGKILGNTLGYESDDDDDDDEVQDNQRDTSPNHDNLSHASPEVSNSHQPHPRTAEERHLALMDQVSSNFENWCDRLADGSLKRHRLETWPELLDA